MRRHHLPRFAAIAAVVSFEAFLLGGSALAQPVQIFEEPPPIELLRSIMIPESRGGLTRKIVITAPDQPSAASYAAPVSVQMPISEPQAGMGADVQAAASSVPQPVRRRSPIQRPEAVPPSAMPQPQPQPVSYAAAPAPMTDALPSMAPGAEEAPAASAGIVGFRIQFALDSAVVPPSAYPFVDRIAELMRQEPQVKLLIEGHTDAHGSDGYNMALSQRRALAVAEYLAGVHGIEPTRLAMIGKGKHEPLTADPFDARNRRVQFVRVE